MKGSEAQKQRPYELLWMLWFDGKIISKETAAAQKLGADYKAKLLY